MASPSGNKVSAESPENKSSTATLALLALGVVYGDIGTSPLYAFKETLNPEYGIALNAATVYGALSAIFWSLMIVVSFKYVTVIMRANNRGEGGILALFALASSATRGHVRWARPVAFFGLAGAALFYGDAVLTPAISVLSAVEGLEIGTAAFKPYVIPITVTVLILLFLFQRYGTGVVGGFFGPICLVWFLALGAVGAYNIAQHPSVLKAINPDYALVFLSGHGFASFAVLGAVLLAVTGAEALYADMGHFGKHPIRIAWFGLVLPALVLNYFGQGALVISDPGSIANPFYRSFPQWGLYPMIVLATSATVIASQATISGTYSLTKQAIQLGYLPRMVVHHTSEKEIGQIYMPAVNWALLAAVLVAVVGFGSSTALASAYGISVVGTMFMTTFLAFVVARYSWRYSLVTCIGFVGVFIMVDGAFFSASLLKIARGGWFPLLMAAIVLTLMLTWRRGRDILMSCLRSSSVPLQAFLESLLAYPPQRVAGTAIFMTSAPDAVPHALLHNLAHNKVLHERVVFVTVIAKDEPFVPAAERLRIDSLGLNCYRIIIYFGFKDKTDITAVLAQCAEQGLEFHLLETSFFLSRENIIPTRNGVGMAFWREQIFTAMARNATSAVEYFNIPANRVIELGAQIEI
jgi:KUP system potassium uptake protein